MFSRWQIGICATLRRMNAAYQSPPYRERVWVKASLFIVTNRRIIEQAVVPGPSLHNAYAGQSAVSLVTICKVALQVCVGWLAVSTTINRVASLDPADQVRSVLSGFTQVNSIPRLLYDTAPPSGMVTSPETVVAH